MKRISNFILCLLLSFLVSCGGGKMENEAPKTTLEIEENIDPKIQNHLSNSSSQNSSNSNQNQEIPNIIKNKELEIILPVENVEEENNANQNKNENLNPSTENSTPKAEEITKPEVEPLKQKESKNYYSPMLNNYAGTIGSIDDKSIFQTNVKIEEGENGYNIKIEASDLFDQMYEEAKSLPESDGKDDTNEVLAVSNFSEKYNFNFEKKADVISYLEKYKENIPDNYKYVGKSNGELTYESKNVPYELYYVDKKVNGKAYFDFKKLQKDNPELEEISCMFGCNLTSSDIPEFFLPDGKFYDLDDLRKYDGGKYANLTKIDGAFYYSAPTETQRFKDKTLLELENKAEEILSETVTEKTLKIKFMGEETGLSYADFGYWQTTEMIEKDNTKFERINIAHPLIGGLESKRISEENLSGKIVFSGDVIANVKEVNKNAINLTGKLDYTLDRGNVTKKEFDAKFDGWYDIKVTSTGDEPNAKDEASNWSFSGNADDNLPIVNDGGTGTVKEVRYYGDRDGNAPLESAGILEYKDKNNTHLTLTFGAKGK